MITILLYVFVFSTWGLGLLSWMAVLGNKSRMWDLEHFEKFIEINQRKLMFNHFNANAKIPGRHPLTVSKAGEIPELPDKLKELMKSSPSHPEVAEIDGTDEIVGVKFAANDYPPGFGDADEDNE